MARRHVAVLGGIVAAVAVAAVLYYFLRVQEPGEEAEVEAVRRRVTEGIQTKSVILFFAAEDGEHLVTETREIVAGGGVEAEIKRVVEALARGPIRRGVPTLPPETTVESVFVDGGGSAYVNFGRELRAFHWGGTSGERLTIRSLVRTLGANFPAVSAVRLLEEGHPLESLAGHVDLSRPLWVDDWR